jgi:hypothetical protein
MPHSDQATSVCSVRVAGSESVFLECR